MVVSVSADGSSFRAGKTRQLFEGQFVDLAPFPAYDVAPDGKRFVMFKSDTQEETDLTHLNFVLNWFEDLKRLVPTGK